MLLFRIGTGYYSVYQQAGYCVAGYCGQGVRAAAPQLFQLLPSICLCPTARPILHKTHSCQMLCGIAALFCAGLALQIRVERAEPGAPVAVSGAQGGG